MEDKKTISMQGSEQLSWDDIDEYAKKHGFNTPSGFIQYITEKGILGVKTKFKEKILYIILILMIAMMTMSFLLIIR